MIWRRSNLWNYIRWVGTFHRVFFLLRNSFRNNFDFHNYIHLFWTNILFYWILMATSKWEDKDIKIVFRGFVGFEGQRFHERKDGMDVILLKIYLYRIITEIYKMNRDRPLQHSMLLPDNSSRRQSFEYTGPQNVLKKSSTFNHNG